MKKWNAQIISHTHWDREWYLNSKYTNEWTVIFFDRLFAMFEKEEQYQFVLDGQMLILDDYFEELKKLNRPVYVYKDKIRKYAQQGRLHLGPYYLQPDWQLISGESLVRNLVTGLEKAREYGNPMATGWLLDNFGQISQTAQIHKEAGIRGLYVWRGVEMDPNNVQSEFVWEAPDGTRLPCVYLLNSYRNVMRLAEYSEIMKTRILGEVEKLKDFMTTKNVLLMNGYDQEIVPDDIQPKIKSGELNTGEIEVYQSNPEAYLDSVLKENPKLMTLKGALYSGRFISVFPGVMSARMYLKLQNDKAQKALCQYAEPFSTLSWALGYDFPQTTLDKAWELILRNHPHDSICGCSIDDVHSDMEDRFRDVHFLADDLIEKSLGNLVSQISTHSMQEKNFIVFNTATYDRNAVITMQGKSKLIEKVPALGYSVVQDEETSLPASVAVKLEGRKVSNRFIEVMIQENGTIDLIEKESGHCYRGLGRLEDAGDAGDEYNYSYPDKDQIFSSTDCKPIIRILKQEDALVEVAIEYDMELPEKLVADRSQRGDTHRKMPVRTKVSLKAESPIVEFKTTIKNTVRDHIVRVLFPSGIETTTSFAGSPFDVVEHPIHIDAYDESMIPENVRKVIVGAREAKPNTIFLGQEFIDVNDSKKGLAILSRGLPEYTVQEKDTTIALTLFRSIGWVAKEINTRIGDAGPEILTPQAQCLRQMEFEYAVYPHQGDYEKGGVIRQADSFNNTCTVVETDNHEGSLPPASSFLRVEDTNDCIRVSSVNKSKKGQYIAVRLYNLGTTETKVKITMPFALKSAERTNFLETKKSTLSITKDGDNTSVLEFETGPKVIETIKMELVRTSVEQAKPANHHCWIFKEDEPERLDSYESYPLVLETEVKAELDRAEKLKPGLQAPLTRRTALEAQLSAILAQNRLDEVKTCELGYQLNEARVERRVYDYIKDTIKK